MRERYFEYIVKYLFAELTIRITVIDRDAKIWSFILLIFSSVIKELHYYVIKKRWNRFFFFDYLSTIRTIFGLHMMFFRKGNNDHEVLLIKELVYKFYPID